MNAPSRWGAWLPNVRLPTASLRAYLTALMLIATAPLVGLMIFKTLNDIQSREARMWQELQRVASATAQNVERELASSIDALTLLGYATLTVNADTAEFASLIHGHPHVRPAWRRTLLIAANGDVLFDSAATGGTGAAAAASVRDNPEFRSMTAQSRPMVSNLITRQDSAGFSTLVAVPVRVDGQLRYVVAAEIDVSAWQELLQASAPPIDGFLTIFDRDHRLVARTRAPERFVGQRLPAHSIEAIGSGASGVLRTALLEGGAIYGAWHKVPASGWGVGVAVPAAPLDAATRQALVTAAVGALLCVVLGLYFASIVARHLVQPLLQLSTTGAIRPGTRIAVREVATLRDALAAAQQRDTVSRGRLQATADEFETLFNSSPIGLAFAQDPHCRVVNHNPAMDALFGPPPGHGAAAVHVLCDGQPLEREQQPLQRAALLGEPVPPIQLEIRVTGLPPRHVLAQAVPLRDADGRPRGAIGAVVDITEQVRSAVQLQSTDQRLRESQHLIELAQEAGHVGFFHYRFETDVLNWTQGQARLFGMQLESHESTLKDWLAHIDVEDRQQVHKKLRRLIAATHERETLEYRVTSPLGPMRWLSSRVLVIYGADRRPQQKIGVSVDVSEEKQAQRERAELMQFERAARMQAEAANQAKDEFLAMLGHELRNPLSAIASAVEVLNRVDAGTDIAAKARAIAARQTRHLAHVMDDLLDVGRVITGKVLLARQVLNLATVARRVAATLEITGEAQRHGVELALEDVWIDADATRIEQVLSNLVTNAVKYTPAGSRIQIGVRVEGTCAVMNVCDNGPGIPETLLPRVFDLFVQGERTLDRRSGGLGIGLTLARRLVELHGGTIDVKSSARGSDFELRLPAIEAPPEREHARQVSPSRRRSVMLIEDNDDALEALRTMLELDGHTVVAARDGVAGLRTLLDLRPDVAVVDIGLPGLTGLEVAKRSRGAGYAGLMIAVSGYGRAVDVRLARAAGFDAHLVKPVNASELQQLIVDS